jgi:hypothetical protein
MNVHTTVNAALLNSLLIMQVKTTFNTVRAAEVNKYTLLNLKHFSICFVQKFVHNVKFSKLMT